VQREPAPTSTRQSVSTGSITRVAKALTALNRLCHLEVHASRYTEPRMIPPALRRGIRPWLRTTTSTVPGGRGRGRTVGADADPVETAESIVDAAFGDLRQPERSVHDPDGCYFPQPGSTSFTAATAVQRRPNRHGSLHLTGNTLRLADGDHRADIVSELRLPAHHKGFGAPGDRGKRTVVNAARRPGRPGSSASVCC
jgi:hypothetical protein